MICRYYRRRRIWWAAQNHHGVRVYTWASSPERVQNKILLAIYGARV